MTIQENATGKGYVSDFTEQYFKISIDYEKQKFSKPTVWYTPLQEV